jgi:twitching motility protein PilT
MRVRETLETAISAAETGHLVLSTRHVSTVAQSLTRVFAFFPSEEQIPARGVIAGSLRGFVCQQLVPKIDGYGRLPVIEILTVDATVKTLIVEGQFEKIQGLLAGSSDSASGSFNKDPYRLWKAGWASARRGWAAENPGAEAPAPPCEGRIASAFGKPDAAAKYFKLLKRF